MKILYSVQATGNGHTSRARQLLPQLSKLGKVDIFLSGSNCDLPVEFPVTFRSRGLSLHYNSTGGLDYWKILRGFHPLSLRKEITDLPVEKYDLVVNDFEFITAMSCAKKGIPSVQVGHQASFHSPRSPRPAKKSAIGEYVLKAFAKATHFIGLHFEQYDDFILPPVIKEEILNATPVDKGHITVYLPSCSIGQLARDFGPFRDFHFHIFSNETLSVSRSSNASFFPIDRKLFDKSLVECTGIICGAGFETPAEALYLKKKLLCVPIRGHYEQQCNAAALRKLGVTCINRFDRDFKSKMPEWINDRPGINTAYGDTIPLIMNRLASLYDQIKTTDLTPEPLAPFNLSEPAWSPSL